MTILCFTLFLQLHFIVDFRLILVFCCCLVLYWCCSYCFVALWNAHRHMNNQMSHGLIPIRHSHPHQMTIRIRYMYNIYYLGRNQIQAATTKSMRPTNAVLAIFGQLLRCFHLYLPCKLHGWWRCVNTEQCEWWWASVHAWAKTKFTNFKRHAIIKFAWFCWMIANHHGNNDIQ